MKKIETENACKLTSSIVKEIENGTFDFMYEINLNRKLSKSHVRKLSEEILKLYNIISDRAVAPIYVVKRTVDNKEVSYILDGQHRVKACIDILNNKNIDININMVVLDGDSLTNPKLVEIISTFNSSSLKWKNLTYVELFAKMKVNGYSKLLKLMQNKKYHATNLAHLYTGSNKGLDMIKHGNKLDIHNGNKRIIEFDDITSKMPEDSLKAKTFRAITTILMLPEYNHTKFIHKFSRFAKNKINTNSFPKTETELYDKMKNIVMSTTA